MVAGDPCMCIATQPTPARAATADSEAETSFTSAPSATRARPWATARSGSRKRPPSEKESGVTFSTPMTRGTAGTVPGLPGRPDQLHGLVAGGHAVPELAPHGRRGGRRARGPHPPHGHAEVLGLDHHEH